jgi:hypothetical protein
MKIQIPTTLSVESNMQFRKLYMEQYGIELKIQEADEEAFRLLSFFAIVLENTPKYYE